MSTTVLIVEDDDMIREMMDLTLTQAGFNVVSASSGEGGLDMLRRVSVKLVLLDVHMPRMSGLEVLAALRRTVTAPPPVLMVTANAASETVREAVRLGCAGYVVKPFTPDALVARVRKTLATAIAPTQVQTQEAVLNL